MRNLKPAKTHQNQAVITIPVGIVALVATLSFSAPVLAENLEHTRKLLATKQCSQCDLSNAGLVFANLIGANLTQANLVGANLSRANLQGADLRGANFTGATLAGANLVGARLEGANLSAVDLRMAYLSGVTVEGAIFNNVLLKGAIGIPASLVKAEDFYRWALEDAERKNFESAIGNFTLALERNPDLAPAHLGRGVARYQLGDTPGAIADAQRANELFKQQNNVEESKIAQAFVKQLQAPPPKAPGPSFGQGLLSVVGTVLQLFLRF